MDGDEHDFRFDPPSNHRVEIYDIETKKCVATKKLDLPEKYYFKSYNYLLDYADSDGYYLWDITKKIMMHFLKTTTFDINPEKTVNKPKAKSVLGSDKTNDLNNPLRPKKPFLSLRTKVLLLGSFITTLSILYIKFFHQRVVQS
jgi:hypothetical protein